MSCRLILCADDFGRSRTIDEGILELAAIGHVAAVSVMVAERRMPVMAHRLSAAPGIDIGLHITLSDGVALTPPSTDGQVERLPDIDDLTVNAFLGRLPLADVVTEVDAQFRRFEQLFGRAPDFVDSHQHAHILPGIRPIVLSATRRFAPHAWVRTCESSLARLALRGVEVGRAWRSSLLAFGLRKQAERLGLRTNDDFAGLYDFRSYLAYDETFPRFLDHACGRNHLVICHPAASLDRADPIGAARFAEFTLLRQAALPEMASARGRVLGRYA